MAGINLDIIFPLNFTVRKAYGVFFAREKLNHFYNPGVDPGDYNSLAGRMNQQNNCTSLHFIKSYQIIKFFTAT